MGSGSVGYEVGYSDGSVRLGGEGSEKEEGRPYVTVEAERDEFARERRWMVRRMSIPTNNGMRYRWLGSRNMS